MYKKTDKIISMCTVASVLLTSSLVTVKVSAATPPENPRLWGADRYETALKISQEGWTNSEYAVIASGEGYADALSAAPLAKVKNAPILLTKKDSISENSLKELKRLGVTHVYIAGGEGAVSKEVENKIKTVVTNIERLEGKDRYETSVKIAEKLGKVDKAIIASGEGYADALSAAPVAAIKGIPVLLTKAKELPSSTKEYLKSAGVTTTFVIGGTAVVSEGVIKVLPEAKRVAGKNRFETNAEVLRAFSTEFDFANAYMALGIGPKGNEFADALAGAALSAKSLAPVILTGKTLENDTKVIAKEKLSPNSTITILGGSANISDALVNSIKITAESLDKEGTTYDKDYAGNAVITGKNITFKDSTVKGDLYVEGNNASLTNIKVEGTIYINPGVDGEATLDNVEAKDIVILSGAKNTIRLKKVKANSLKALNRAFTRLVAETGTEIKTTIALSNTIIEGLGGSFGDIKISKTVLDKAVELRGRIDKTVVIEGNVDFKVAAGANVAKIEIRSAATDTVTLSGNLGTVEVYTAANIKFAPGASATVKAMTDIAKASAKVEIQSGASVTVDGIAKDNIIGNTGSTSGGGGGGGSVTTKTYYLEYGDLSLKLGTNATIKSVYDAKKDYILNTATLRNKIELALDKAVDYKVDGLSFVDYVIERLTDANPSSEIAAILDSTKTNAEKAAALTNHIADKDFEEVYTLVLDRIVGLGAETIPTFEGKTNELKSIDVTINGTTLLTKEPGDSVNITTARLKELLGITKDTQLSELMKKTMKVVVKTTADKEYTLEVKNGVITSDFGKGYEFKLVAR